MSSPEYWEAHHALARLEPGDSWFGPLTAHFARQYVRERYATTCATMPAVVLGCGFSKTAYHLAATGAFSAVFGVDSSVSSIRKMRTFAAGRPGWERVRFLHRDVKALRMAPGRASLVVDEGVLDILQGIEGGRTSASQLAMASFLTVASRLVDAAGLLVLVGFAGGLEVVANVTGFDTTCWARSAGNPSYREHTLRMLASERRNPRQTCSPWGPGAYLLRRQVEASAP